MPKYAYPSYVRYALRYAWELGKYYYEIPKAVTMCFDVLADFPDCRDAMGLIYDLMCDEWTVYHERIRNFDRVEEYDDRPHSQQERLAYSYGGFSEWERLDKQGEPLDPPDEIPEELIEVGDLLDEGKMQLFVAYTMGHEPSADYAWTRFMEAMEKTYEPIATLMWIAEEYAERGCFADATDVLTELLSKDPGYKRARRLLAEVRYRRIHAVVHPDRKSHEEELKDLLARMKVVGTAPTWEPSLDRTSKRWVDDLPVPDGAPFELDEAVVDWSYLDELSLEEWAIKVPFDELSADQQKYHTEYLAKELTEDDRARHEKYILDVRGREYRRSLIEMPFTKKLFRRTEEEYFDDEDDEDEYDDDLRAMIEARKAELEAEAQTKKADEVLQQWADQVDVDFDFDDDDDEEEEDEEDEDDEDIDDEDIDDDLDDQDDDSTDGESDEDNLGHNPDDDDPDDRIPV